MVDKHIDFILPPGTAKNLKLLPKNPTTFRSLFAFQYAYYYFYATDAKAKVHTNDFNDLTFTLAAPLCERFYTEKRLAYAMNQVKRLTVPSHREAMGKVVKVVEPYKTRSERRKDIAKYSPSRFRLLQDTDIFSMSELRQQLEALDE